MRKTILLAAVLVACSKGETPSADTAAAMAPAPPANLTAADFTGTWNGTSTKRGSDSVVARWVAVRSTDSTGTITYEGTKTPVPMTSVFDADSVVTMSAAFAPPGAKKGAPKVMFRSVGRMRDGKLVGTSETMLATNHDSIVSRRNFVATKAP